MKTFAILLVTIVLIVIIDASLIKIQRRRSKRQIENANQNEVPKPDEAPKPDQVPDEVPKPDDVPKPENQIEELLPEYVIYCYREGRECCFSFTELCHNASQCQPNEVCCYANCMVQCYPIDKLGITPDKVIDQKKNKDVNNVLNNDPDYIRYPTNADLSVKPNRTDCFPRTNETCCYYYFEECHDTSDCEQNEICCEEDCGSMCYPKDKVGEKIFEDDDSFDELVDNRQKDDSLLKDVEITASKEGDGSLHIVVRPVKN